MIDRRNLASCAMTLSILPLFIAVVHAESVQKTGRGLGHLGRDDDTSTYANPAIANYGEVIAIADVAVSALTPLVASRTLPTARSDRILHKSFNARRRRW